MAGRTQKIRRVLDDYPYAMDCHEEAVLELLQSTTKQYRMTAKRIKERTNLEPNDFRNIVINSFGFSCDVVTYGDGGRYYSVKIPDEHCWPERNTAHPCGLPNSVIICRTQCYLADHCDAAKRFGLKRQAGLKKLNLQGEGGLYSWKLRSDDSNNQRRA